MRKILTAVLFALCSLFLASTAMADEQVPGTITTVTTTTATQPDITPVGMSVSIRPGYTTDEAPASAWKVTAFTMIASGYAYTEDGEVLSKHAVSQTDFALIHGKWSFDVFLSAGISGKGAFGNRGYQDEVDFTTEYDDLWKSFLGPLDVQLQASYCRVADFANAHGNNDLVALHADFGRSFPVGKATVTPYVRATAWLGLGVFDNTYLTSVGTRFSTPLKGRWSFDANIGWSEDWTDHYGTVYLTAGPSYDLGHNLTVSVQIEVIHSFAAVEEPPVIGMIRFIWTP